MTVNPATLKLTSKGQTTQLSAIVLLNNAENKSIVWSTSNASVATVDNNGVVTAVANGNATITASAVDGSGKNGSCNVVVEIPSENAQIIELAGGDSIEIGPTKASLPNFTDFSNITFDIQNSNNIVNVSGFSSNKVSASVCIRGVRVGSVVIIAKHNGTILQRYTVNVTANWGEYLAYESWRHSIEKQIWTNDISSKGKMDAAKNYIQTHFTHKDGAPAAWYAYTGTVADCITASEFMGGFAADAGLKIQYGSTLSGQYYDYLVNASSAGGHTFTRIFINDSWEIYDANPPH